MINFQTPRPDPEGSMTGIMKNGPWNTGSAPGVNAACELAGCSRD